MNGLAIRAALGPIFFILGVVGVVAFAHAWCGCAARQPGDLPAYCYSEELYTAKLLRCVDDAETLAQSQMCRQQTDYTCGIRQTTRAK